MVLKPKSAPVTWTMTMLADTLRKGLCALPDVRKGGNNLRYTMGDAALGTFSVFFMQSPSFLDFQVRMQKARGRNHANSLFGIAHTPSMQQMRNLLDPVSPAQVAPLFMALVEPIVADGGLTSHRVLDGRLWWHSTAPNTMARRRFTAQRAPRAPGQWQDPVLPYVGHAGDRRPWAGGGPTLGPGVCRAAGRTG